MKTNNIGLVLEGGGFRGIYSAGILDFFLEKNIHFPYVIGVSMGACNGANYISRQHGRNIRIPYKYINDNRYISFSNLIKTGDLFGMDFIFKDIPEKMDLFDNKTFNNSNQKFVVVTTDCKTGNARYFYKDEIKELSEVLTASSSLPFISKMVNIDGNFYLDGGISDSIPAKKAVKDRCEKLVIILTRPKGYKKDPLKLKLLGKYRYRKYPKVMECMKNRYIQYNDSLKYVDELEAQNKAFVIRPKDNLDMGRVERDKKKLKATYDLGYNDAVKLKDRLLEFLS